MFQRLQEAWRRVPPGVKAVLLFSMAFALYGWWQGTPYFPDPDSLYHIKIAQIIATEGIPQQFPWLYYTPWREAFVDHHFLYHLLIAPFVIYLPDSIGMKLITIILAASVPTVMYILFHKYGTRFPWMFAFLVAAAAPFTFRMNLGKTSAISVVILVIILFLLLKRKSLAALIISFLYMLTYGGAPVAVAVAGLVFVVDCIYGYLDNEGTWKTRLWNAVKANYKTPVAVGIGIVAGLVINPFFPENLHFLWEQFVQIGIINQGSEIGVGIEWYPYAMRPFLTGNAPLLVLTVPAIALMFLRIKELDRESAISFILMLFFLAITLKSRRYIEYYVPFGFIYAAFAITAGYNAFEDQIKEFIARIPSMEIPRRALLLLLALYFGGFFAYIIGRGSIENSRTLAFRGTIDQYRGAGEYLEQNAEKGDLVLQSSWDQFPPLFYHSHKPYYMGGLDATFTYHYDSDIYWKWTDVTTGKIRKNVSQAVKELGADWVFVASTHTDMRRNIEQFTDFELVFEDDEAAVFRVK